jgi:hypothetical protein
MKSTTLSLAGVTPLPAVRPGLYPLKIVSVENTVSSNKNPMLKLTVVPKGLLAIIACLTYENESQLRRVRQMAEAVVASNPGKLSIEDLEAASFDFAKLEGLEVGGDLVFKDETHKYLMVRAFLPLKDVQ